MYPSVTAAVVENIGPASDAGSFYGASMQLASRFVSQSMLESTESIQSVAEAIWKGLEIITSPVGGTGSLPAFGAILGGMSAATKRRANETGANPGFYDAAWHVAYSG